MATQRIGSGIVLFLIAAAGLVLLRPGWFPDIPLPTALMDAGMERMALGGFLILMVAVILAGIVMEQHRAEESRRRSRYVGPALGSVADEPAAYTPPSYTPSAPDQPVAMAAWSSDVEATTEQPLEPAVEHAPEPVGEPEPDPAGEPTPELEPVPVSDPAPEPIAPAGDPEPDVVEAVEAPPPSTDPVESPWPRPVGDEPETEKA